MNNSQPKLASSEIEAAIASARAAYCQLLTLNHGGIAEDREPLELSLDRSVVLLGKLLTSTQVEDLEILSRALRDIRDYRRLFPRTAASDPEQARQAQRILGELS